MSVITGETGAGKSIILGALGLTLGDRADKTIVRGGTKQADISAEFNISHVSTAQQWLLEHDIEIDCGVCIIRRVVNNDGRSKGYINGSPVTLSSLKILGEMLIDIHSQHEHQSLLRRSTHQRLLDDFCVEQTLLKEMQLLWKQWQQNFHKLQEICTQSEEHTAQSQL
ncbi:MAG: AAA family ATPase, partial [Pseudomonadota bacterium]|nr:AAA family ATPase [Pseudomonadota bacterium]